MVRIKASTLTEVLVSILIVSILITVLLRFLPSVSNLVYPIGKTQVVTRADSILIAVEEGKFVLPRQEINQVNYQLFFEQVAQDSLLSIVTVEAILRKKVIAKQTKIISIED